jgi:Mg-chelatase subunit ChlD
MSAVIGSLLWGTSPVQAQDMAGGVGTKENLDLPFDAGGEQEEEEDAPEIVTFYGEQLEGDGIFYTVDRSSSMGDKGELAIAKRELARNIQEFSDRVQFGIVFFDAGIMKFPSSGQPATANPGMKSSAMSFVQSVGGGGGSCVQQGLTQTLQMANLSSAKRKVMVYLGDGRGHCQGANEETYLRTTLSAVTSQNYQRIPINCIMVLDRTDRGEDFMRKLSASNSGTYSVKVR